MVSVSRIVDALYKVGFVPFTRTCMSNPLVRYELDDKITESGSHGELQNISIATTIEAEIRV